MNLTESFYEGKKILVTGSAGTIGAELVRQLLELPDRESKTVIGIDNNESALFLQSECWAGDHRTSFFALDITDLSSMSKIMAGVDIVFHCAAMKHVTICERSPDYAAAVNISGTQNVINAAKANNCSFVVFTSSDKAVNPTNLMGATKLVGERLISAAGQKEFSASSKTIFCSTRFGNVVGSNGSVLNIFQQQIQNGGPVTLTDNAMSRFVMTKRQAAELVLKSPTIANGGEVFITKMPALRIRDLAEVMLSRSGSKASNIEVVEIGSKIGEKLYEELITAEELGRCSELEDYLIVSDFFSENVNKRDVGSATKSKERFASYNSRLAAPMSAQEIHEFLDAVGRLG